jgi:hypothetical protein
MGMRRYLLVLIALAAAAVGHASEQAAGRYLDRDEFLGAAFPDGMPEQGVLWMTEELREHVESVLGHRFAMLRVRYWYVGDATAWVLDEIGKEEPITIGVTVRGGAIEMVRVLEFRESRGFEVRYPFFTDQFNGARLGKDRTIDRHIDGITGATLSVRAMNSVVKMALILHEETGVGTTRPETKSASTS